MRYAEWFHASGDNDDQELRVSNSQYADVPVLQDLWVIIPVKS